MKLKREANKVYLLPVEACKAPSLVTVMNTVITYHGERHREFLQ